MRNIFSKTTAEKRTQNGVKTDSKRTNYGISILIFAFLTLGVGQMWGAKERYIYCGISNNYDTYKDGSNWGFNFWGGTSAGVKSVTYIADDNHDGRNYKVFRVQVYDDNNKAQFKGNDSWWVPKDGYSVTLNGTTNNAVYFSASADGWEGQFQKSYQVTSTASLAASSTSVAIGTNVTLTPSLASNQDYNELKSTSYSVTTNPNSGGSVTSGGVFSATKAGSYTVTATVTYNAKDFSGITKTATATKTITVYATVTFDREGGSGGTGSQNATYNTATSSITAPTKTNYDFGGYYDGDNGTGNQIINASGVWQKNKSGFTDNSATPKWIILTNVTLYAKWTPKSYSITYKDKGGSDYSGSNGGSLPSSYTYGTGIASLTDGVKSGYRFDGWFDNSDCTGSAVTSISTTATGAKTFYAKWTETPGGTVTLTAGTGGEVSKDNSSWGTSKSYTGIKTTDALNIYARANAGYTFSAWSKTSGLGTISSTSSASTTFTPVANADAALTASFTENKVTLTPTVSYDHGSSNYTASSSNTVGVATTTNLSCSNPNAAHYTFAGWTLTNLTVTSGNAATDRNITVKITTPGSPIAAVANYNENLNTTWYICGASGGTSPFSGWGTGGTRMYKKSGYSTVEKYYCTISVASVADASGFGFKAYKSDESDDAHRYFAYSDQNYTIDNNSQTIYNNNGANDMHFKAYVTGDYEFEIDKTSANPVLTIHWPIYNQVRISAASSTDATNVGNFDMSDPVSNVRTVTRSLKANTTYTFKIMYNSDWYGYNSGTFTRNSSTSSNSRTLSTSGGNLTLTTDYAGDYTFRFNQSTKDLSVDFPTAYKVTYGKGTVDGSSSSCSAKDIDNGNAAVTSNSTWVKSGNHVVLTAPAAKTGYTYNGWFDNNSGTGTAITTNANCTITVSSALTRYACYTINNYAITHSASSHGSYTIQVGSAAAVSANTTSDYGKTITLAATPATGYHFGSWSVYKTGTPATTVTVTDNKFTMPDYAVTVGATFTPNTYRVQFHRNGASEATVYQDFTYDVAQNLTANTYTRTGYTFAGWALSTDGTVEYANGAEVSNLTSENGATFHLYAKWTPISYTVVLNKQTSAEGYGGSEGTVANQTVTFDATPATVSGTMPTAKNGWAFMGFYSAEDGGGRRFIDPSGNWITSAGDTISGGKWVKPEGITLYAYYKKAQITNLSFDAAVVAPSASVGVTPTVAPTPEGTNSICWKLLYNNGNLYTPQPTFSPENPGGVGNKVTFNAPPTSGMYLVAAVLRTGNDCNGGTKLDSVTYPFQVAGDHTVTVQYKCGNTTIAASTTTIGRPLVWSSAIAAPEIFGYTFHHWLAGDGVTLSEDGENAKTGERADSSVVSSIYIKAIYDGKLTAVYTQENIIYFKDNLGWTDPADPDAHVYVNLLTTDKWTDDKGTGNSGVGVTNRNLTMNRVEGTTDIFYYNYGNKSVTYVSFTKESMDNYDYFYEKSPDVAHVVFPTRYADALTTDKVSEAGFKAMTPMFVPLKGQTGIKQNDDRADYYNRGYWTMYTPGTGYTLEIYNEYGNSLLKSIAFTSEDDLMPMKAVADLEAGHNYKYQIRRGGTGSDGVYYGNSGTMTYKNHGQSTAWDMSNPSSFSMVGIEANAAGDYIFHLSYSTYGDVDAYRLRIAVDYPIAGGDYRVIYKDDAHTSKPSAIVTNANNAKDTVSFFIRHNQNPSMKIQQATVDGETGAITWNDVEGGTVDLSSITQTGVYNICLTMDGSGAISVENKEPYTGNFYIRTDCAVSKWDNYKNADHLMTYSLYSEEHSDFSHYFMGHVYGGTNVKFVVANDYSPCISDTLIVSTYRGGDADHVWDSDGGGHGAGDLKADEANIRFMWNRANNAVYRAYLAPAQSDGSNFLVLRGTTEDNLMDENGNPLRNASNSEQDGYNHKAPDHCIQFVDDENWIYEATVQVKPSSYVKLYALFNSGYFYYKGTKDDIFDDSHAIKLVEGSGDAVKVRVIYDFKTDRLVAAYMPSGEISTEMDINADVMFIREHQGDIDQLTFTNDGSIRDIKTAYAVMRFNKWTLNNKEKTGSHNPLASPASIYERSLYYVSFPFRVKLSEVFGFGTYGQHWIIQRYRGDLRAQQGFWAESAGFWEFIWNRNGEVYLEPNEGYILTLETELLGVESDVWGPRSVANQVELYFPSYSDVSSITNASITQTLPAHTCTINRHETEGLPDTSDPSTSYNRTIFDSHWNIMSVPTYVNVNNPSFANTTWIANDSCPKFLYTWNPDDNTLTATSGTGFMYHAMHAYTVQYYGKVTWTTSVTPAAAPQRNTEYRGEYEFCLEVQQDEQMIDRTYVRLSDDENVTTGFEFGEDMTKQFNSRKANIFTIAGNTSLGGNSLPLSTTQTTVVPVGVSIKSAGDYTFAIPEGTEGIGVTLVDNETGTRTSLSALSYTVTLQPGNITDRFVLEISPIHNTPTGLEEPTSDSSLKGRAQKVMIDGILYIVKDGKIFDARGARVQ